MASTYHTGLVTDAVPQGYLDRRQEAQQLKQDQELRQDYQRTFKDPMSFASGAMRMNDTVGQIIVNASSGNMTRAAEIYQGLNQFISGHSDDIARAAFIAPSRDSFMNAMQQSANRMIERDFDRMQVRLVDGSQSTIGELFREGGLYETRRRQELRNAEFTERTISVMDGDDEDQKLTVGMFVNPRIGTAKASTPEGDPGQYVEMGDLLANRGAEFREGLGGNGDAVRVLAGHVRAHHMQDGTATMMFKTLYDMTKARLDSGAASDPIDAATQVARSYDALVTRVSGSKDPAVNRFFATVTMDAVSANPDLDLDDPNVQYGMDRLANVFAADSRAGIPLVAHLYGSGGRFGRAAAEFVNFTADGLEPPEGNMIVQLERSMQRLGSLLTPGWSPTAPVPANPNTQAGEASGVFQRSSGSPGLDAATIEIYRALREPITSEIARGRTEQDAFLGALSNADTVGAVADAISRSMLLSADAAQGVAATLLRQITGTGVQAVGIGGLEQAVQEFALGSQPGEPDDIHDARKQARRWIAANLGSTARGLDLLVSQELDPILNDPVNGIIAGKDGAVQANYIRQRMKAGALDIMSAGGDPRSYLRGQGGVGRYYQITGFRDSSGRVVDQPPKDARAADYVPVVSEIVGKLDAAQQPYEGLVIPGFGPVARLDSGAWSDPRRKSLFKTQQMLLQRVYKAQMESAAKEYKDAVALE